MNYFEHLYAFVKGYLRSKLFFEEIDLYHADAGLMSSIFKTKSFLKYFIFNIIN